jgi:hypothetical protein
LDLVDEHVGGDLHKDVTNIEDTETCGILIIVQLKVILQALEASSRNVVSIEIVHDVNQNEESATSIELEFETLLDSSTSFGIHCSGEGETIAVRNKALEVLLCLEGGFLSSSCAGGSRVGDVVGHDGEKKPQGPDKIRREDKVGWNSR